MITVDFTKAYVKYDQKVANPTFLHNNEDIIHTSLLTNTKNSNLISTLNINYAKGVTKTLTAKMIR
jgi:hypothetical protein